MNFNTINLSATKSLKQDLENVPPSATLITKFARNGDVDAAEDIWHGGGDYTDFPTTTAEEFQVASSDLNDTAAGTGARTVRCYYLDSNYNAFDASGNLLYFDVTLNGTTYVNSGVSGMRIWRLKVLTSGSGQTNAGDITVRWRTTTAVVFIIAPAGFGGSQVSNFTIPVGYTGCLVRYSATMDDNTANAGILGIKVREFNSNTFRIIRSVSLSTTKNVEKRLFVGEIFAEKTDFCFRMTQVTNANAIVTVDYALLLYKN